MKASLINGYCERLPDKPCSGGKTDPASRAFYHAHFIASGRLPAGKPIGKMPFPDFSLSARRFYSTTAPLSADDTLAA